VIILAASTTIPNYFFCLLTRSGHQWFPQDGLVSLQTSFQLMMGVAELADGIAAAYQ